MASSSAAESSSRLSDRGFYAARRSALGLRFMVLLMHVLFVGAVFILDPTLDWRIHGEPWYIGLYGVLVLLTLVQYFYTAGSCPGYVIDVMRAGSMMHATFVNTAALSKWYIFEETILCIWTAALCIESLCLDVDKAWWKDFVGVILLAALILILIFLLLLWLFHSYIALTNQTTYEIARRKRIFYLRGVPERVLPFSKGICRNLYDFCCSSQKGYILEAVPPSEELEARAARYTCRDVICCRCC
ncbi:Protein S-acyltransferase 10 [Zea mays]|uniref:Protein S-acyltransferase 10 n=1 Tax=Zea mays TaxID=4577 RepID=A0A1D6HFK5_MAIZE|nr:Protein S-acyltransferase 10 [Zea mays]